jgi:DNA repair protein RadC
LTNKANLTAIPSYQHPGGLLIAQGAAALSNTDLLATILRTGGAHESAVELAARILEHFGGLHGLAQAHPADLQRIAGIGSAQTAQIIAALELSKRLLQMRSAERPLIQTAADAARFLADMAFLTQEHVRVILLDTGRRVIAAPTIYIGTINTSAVRVAEILREAVSRSSPAIILAHNHPSGDPTPSPEDVELTRALASAGHLLDIALVDHVIIGQQRWVSLREQGFLG